MRRLFRCGRIVRSSRSDAVIFMPGQEPRLLLLLLQNLHGVRWNSAAIRADAEHKMTLGLRRQA